MRKIILKTAVFSLGGALCLFPGPNAARALDHAPQARQETPQFFESLEDIPLMPGLQELPGETLTFDKPEGRIVETAAILSGEIGREQVLLYYQSVLPRFGWGKSGENEFFRAGEVLRISFDGNNGRTVARFLIKPVL